MTMIDQYYEQNKHIIVKQHRVYRARKKVEAVQQHLFTIQAWSGIKSRAKQKGQEFSVERKDYYIPTHCPALGIPLDYSDRNHTPSLDRVDNTKGYTPGNVVVVSCKANTLKREASIEELNRMVEFYGSLR